MARPGILATVSLHWIAKQDNFSSSASQTSSIPLDFRAELYGPYPSVTALKTAPTASPAVLTSATYTTDTWSGVPSSIQMILPANLKPGYDNLVTRETAPGSSNDAGFVIQVVR